MKNPNIKFEEITTGAYWLEFTKRDVKILCGSPPDISKHLIQKSYVKDSSVDGVYAQTGPDAILITDSIVHAGEMRNLIEFPVLQMFYFQGTLLPNHPNNTPENRPVLIGAYPHIERLMSYIFFGNYGLIDRDDFLASNIEPDVVDNLIAAKLRFAFGKFKSVDQMLSKLYLSSNLQQVKKGVYAKHLGWDRYLFCDDEDSIEVDLSIPDNKVFSSTYNYPTKDITPAHFSVIDIGCGDGWDPERPCFGSIVQYKKQLYMIDTGPSIRHSLSFLNTESTDIRGIFLTHGHDDHIAGLTAFMSTGRSVKLYATSLVRNSITRKMSSLLDIPEEDFTSTFEVVDLEYNTWNNLDGLEVMPLHSLHPVDCCIYLFRVKDSDGSYKSYLHCGDICSFDVLKKFTEPDPSGGDQVCSKEFIDEIKANYLREADLKKIDIGGGLIHGVAQDFKEDNSKTIIFGHSNKAELPEEVRAIGDYVPFGHATVLIEHPPE